MEYNAVERSQRLAARLAGFLLLLTMATAVFAEFYAVGGLVVSGDAAQTARNIAASEPLFRLGIISELVTVAGVVVLIAALYILLKPVNGGLALVAFSWRLVENAVLGFVALYGLISLRLLSGANYLAAYDTSQLQASAYLFIGAHTSGYQIGMIFYSLGSTLFSYLFFKSRYVPRILSAWGVFASLVVLVCTVAIMLVPQYVAILAPAYFMPSAAFEVLLGLWLLFIGANVRARGTKSAAG